MTPQAQRSDHNCFARPGLTVPRRLAPRLEEGDTLYIGQGVGISPYSGDGDGNGGRVKAASDS